MRRGALPNSTRLENNCPNHIGAVNDTESGTRRSEMQHYPRADAEVVLVIIGSVIKGGQQVVGFDEPHSEAAACAQVEASAEVGGKGRACIGGGRIGALHQLSAGVRQADQRLAEGLQGRVA